MGLFKKKCRSCESYSAFVSALSEEQKEKLVLWESSVIEMDGQYDYVGALSQDEFDLLKKDRIRYTSLVMVVDEKTRRTILANSLLKGLKYEDRDLIVNHKAAISYRAADDSQQKRGN